MKKVLLVAATGLFAASLQAATLDIGRNIELLVLNQQKVDEVPIALEDGENQLVIRYEGRIKGKGKSVHITSTPYVLRTDTNGEQTISITFIPRTEAQFERFEQESKSLFRVTVDGKPIKVDQVVLPRGEGFMPYSNIPQLVKQYNRTHGIYFESGEINTAQQLALSTNESMQTTDPEVVKTLTNLGQLKAWYLKASKQERKEFRRWMIDQE